jgi:hypothetical protein
VTQRVRAAVSRVVIYAGVALCLSVAMPISAQMRMGMKDKIVDAVANELVTTIQSDSCADFAAMLKQRKSGSRSSTAGGMMKKDPAARARFVNKVAGPLLNKMIDCNLLPGR